MCCLEMPGRSQSSTHSEPSSGVGVVLNVQVCYVQVIAGVIVLLGPQVSVHSYFPLFICYLILSTFLCV